MPLPKIELTPERKLVRARVQMLFSQPFFGHLSMKLELQEQKGMDMPTMATDGSRLFYDPDFVMNSPEEKLAVVIAHEIDHIILFHLPRRQKKLGGKVKDINPDDALKWNWAADFAANDLLHKEPKFGPHMSGMLIPGNPKKIIGKGNVEVDTKQFENKSVEWIFGKLPDPISREGGGGYGGDGEGGDPVDSHAPWGDWGKDKDKDGKGGGEGDKPPTSGNEPSGEGPEEDLEQEWKSAVASAATIARSAGKFPGHLRELVDGLLQPKLDWRAILRDMITSAAKNNWRWCPPSKKHLARKIYMPSLYGENICIGVWIDTSGSISSQDMKVFLSEVKGICDQYDDYTIYLRTCDTRINDRWELTPLEPLPNVLSGRGGTSYKEIMEEADQLPITSAIVMTDLYPNDGFQKPPSVPVIWIATTDRIPPYGYTIRYPKNGQGN